MVSDDEDIYPRANPRANKQNQRGDANVIEPSASASSTGLQNNVNPPANNETQGDDDNVIEPSAISSGIQSMINQIIGNNESSQDQFNLSEIQTPTTTQKFFPPLLQESNTPS